MKRLFKKRDLTFLPAIALILTAFMLLSAAAYGFGLVIAPFVLTDRPWTTEPTGRIQHTGQNPPGAITNLRATSDGVDWAHPTTPISSRRRMVTLAWDIPANTSSFTITWETNENTRRHGTLITGFTSNSITAHGLRENVQYTFRIHAVNQNVTPHLPGPIATFVVQPNINVAVPNPPATQVPNSITHNSATLRWNAPAAIPGRSILQYEVQWQRQGATGTPTTRDARTNLTFAATGLTANTTYQFRVRAQNANGWSAWSGWRNFTTTQAPARYTLGINHHFDVQFDNLSNNANTNIINAHDRMANMMREIFSVNVTRNTPVRFTSVGTNRDQILTNFNANTVGTQRNMRSVWSGRTNTGVSMYRRSTFTTFMSHSATFPTPANVWDTTNAGNVLLHEFAHHLGTRDHYCYFVNVYPGQNIRGPRPDGRTCENRENCYMCRNGIVDDPNLITSALGRAQRNCVMWTRNNANSFGSRDIFCSDCTGTISSTIRNNQ